MTDAFSYRLIAQDGAAACEGRASGEHVIDQQDIRIADSCRRPAIRADCHAAGLKHPRKRAESIPTAAAGLGALLSGPDDNPAHEWQSRGACNPLRD